MLHFLNEQKVFEISGTRFGGQPGKKRTVMVGSIGYPRHSMVEDRTKGTMRKGALEAAMEKLHSAMDETKTPAAVMLYAETAEAMHHHLEEASSLTKLPLFIDSPSAAVRLAGARRAGEMGIASRCIYNTLNAGCDEEELKGLQDTKIEAAVLLAFNPADIATKGKIYLLENGGTLLQKGLIEMAQEHGIKKPLLDLAVMAAEQQAGAALRGIMVAKAKWGWPCGCALHNAVESYAPLRDLVGDDRKLYRFVDAAAATMPIMAGGDFVMYGPIESARRMFYVAAFADELMAQAATDI